MHFVIGDKSLVTSLLLQLFCLDCLVVICSGRSEGKAFVVYERRQDAEQALEQYDNVALDGKPMKIAFATGGLQLASGIRSVPLPAVQYIAL